MNEKQKNLLGQIVLLMIGVGMYAYTVISDLEIRVKNDIGSGGVPKMVCGIIIALSLLKIIIILSDKRQVKKGVKTDNINYPKGFAIITVLAIYCFAIKFIGFPILNPLMMFAEMCLMAPKEKRNYILFAVLSVVSTLVIFISFYYGLELMLPAGILRKYL